MNCAMCSEMCAGMFARSKGERTFAKPDGRNSPSFFCGTRGQPPPKLGTLHPPTWSSAARIPTSAKRDHWPKLKRVKSCSRVCCRAGWTESTAERGTDHLEPTPQRYRAETCGVNGGTGEGARHSTGIIHSAAPRLDPSSLLVPLES